MDKVKIGVIGGGRGKSMIRYGREASNAELVAICDFRDDVLERMKKECGEDGISYYSDYDEFLKHDMDAVVLANYANQHAPFAIKAMKAGKHVFSEVLPVQTLKEAVELIETVEETEKIYAYGENYCFMSAPFSKEHPTAVQISKMLSTFAKESASLANRMPYAKGRSIPPSIIKMEYTDRFAVPKAFSPA